MRRLFTKLKANRGQSLIELIIVMAMIGLLGGAIMGLMATGGSAYQKVTAVQDVQREARLALSYVTVKVRQNDVSGGIVVLGPSSLRIFRPAPATGQWDIGIAGSDLVETTATGTSIIAEDVGFGVTFDNLTKQLQITITYDGGAKQLTETITLRSD